MTRYLSRQMHCCRKLAAFIGLWLPDWCKSLRPNNGNWRCENQLFRQLGAKTSSRLAGAFVLSYQLFCLIVEFFTAHNRIARLARWQFSIDFLRSFCCLLSLSNFWSPNRLFLQVTITDRWRSVQLAMHLNIPPSHCTLLVVCFVLRLSRRLKRNYKTKRREEDGTQRGEVIAPSLCILVS